MADDRPAIAASDADTNGVIYYTDNSFTERPVHYYRVRYTFGGHHSAASNVLPLDGWFDSDGDGISDRSEGTSDPAGATDTDGDGTPDYLDTDSDNDGVSDAEEAANGTNPKAGDTDGDGLSDAEEKDEGTDPTQPDTDGDGKLDGQDGWPLEKFITTTRLPVTRYAVIVCATGNDKTPSCLNNRGDVVYMQSGNLFYRPIDGTPSEQIHNTNWSNANEPHENRSVVGISDEPRVFGVWSRVDQETFPEQHDNFAWAPGNASIAYTVDRFSLPGNFRKDDAKTISAGSKFSMTFISPSGVAYGSDYSGANRYYPTRSVGVLAPGRNGVAIPDYAHSARLPGDSWIHSGPSNIPLVDSTYSFMHWGTDIGGIEGAAWQNPVFNSFGDVIFKYEGFTRRGFAPSEPAPGTSKGTYFIEPGGAMQPAGVPIDDCVAMSTDKHVLTTGGIYASNSDLPHSALEWRAVATPRISHAGALPVVVWQAFNNRLQAIGTRSLSPPLSLISEPVVLINDLDYLLHDLLPPEWRIESLTAINYEGMILASARQVLDELGDPIPYANQESSVVLLLPIEIFPDDGMVGVVGDVVPSIKGPRGKKHFVSPKKNAAIPNTHVLLKKAGISDWFFQQYCKWGNGGEPVAGQSLKRQVSRVAADSEEVTLELKSTGQTLARMKVWTTWAGAISTRKPTGHFVHPERPSKTYTTGDVTFMFTIAPASMLNDRTDIRNLKGPNDPAYPVPDGEHIPENGQLVFRRWKDGVTTKWDVSRQMQIEVDNPGHIPLGSFDDYPINKPEYDKWNARLHNGSGILEPWPGNPYSLAGNDDSFPHGWDEDDDPYAPTLVGGALLSHGLAQVTSTDTPILLCPNPFIGRNPVPNGTTYRMRFDFREFLRLQIGKQWYRVSDRVDWWMELKVKIENGEWSNDNSDYAPK